jgi:hypothetical protein
MRRILIPLLALAPVLAGCGGGAAKTTNAASQSPTTATATAPSTVAPATTAAPQFTGNASSSWCDLVRSLTNVFKVQTIAQDAHGWVNTVNTVIPQAEAKAPAPRKADVDSVGAAALRLAQVVAADGYQVSKVTPVQLASVTTPDLAAATDRVTAYDQQVCKTSG